MKPETSQSDDSVGLYRDPESGNFIGAIDRQQANAFVRAGFKLVEEGREAALKTEDEIELLKNPPEHEVEEPQDDAAKNSSKKGK